MQHLIFYRNRGPGFAAALDSVDRQWYEPKVEIGAVMPGPAPHRWMLYYQGQYIAEGFTDWIEAAKALERIILQDYDPLLITSAFVNN